MTDTTKTEKIKAVHDREWKNCPHCKGQTVGTVENGFIVDGFGTDLMVCYDCGKLYIVFPDSVMAPPEEVEVAITEDLTEKASEMIRQGKENREVFKEGVKPLKIIDLTADDTIEVVHKGLIEKFLVKECGADNYKLIGGHLRVRAMFELGEREIPADLVDASGQHRPVTLLLGGNAGEFPFIIGVKDQHATPHITVKFWEGKWVANVYGGTRYLFTVAAKDTEDACREAAEAWCKERGKDYPIKGEDTLLC